MKLEQKHNVQLMWPLKICISGFKGYNYLKTLKRISFQGMK